jgi:hypothetical protein
MANASEIFQNKRVQLIGAVVLGLLLIGGGATYFMTQSNTGATPPPGTMVGPGGATGAPGMPGGSGGPVAMNSGGAAMPMGAPGMVPGMAGGPGAPMGAGPGALSGRPANVSRTGVVVTPPRNSFSDAPVGYGGGAVSGGGGMGLGSMPGAMPSGGPASMPGSASMPGGMVDGMPGGPMGGGSRAGGGATGAPKPLPILNGRVAQGARQDPFLSFAHLIVMKPPAYSFIAPIRLASRPTPPPPPPVTDPDLRFGPLPAVERRVAGVLFDGSVSAILETGTPGGAGTDVRVIQPGATVPSGVPTVEDLTVASITPSQVVLRAQDGRTTTVKLSNVPAAFAEQFRNAASGSGVGQGPGGPGALDGGSQTGSQPGRFVN